MTILLPDFALRLLQLGHVAQWQVDFRKSYRGYRAAAILETDYDDSETEDFSAQVLLQRGSPFLWREGHGQGSYSDEYISTKTLHIGIGEDNSFTYRASGNGELKPDNSLFAFGHGTLSLRVGAQSVVYSIPTLKEFLSQSQESISLFFPGVVASYQKVHTTDTASDKGGTDVFGGGEVTISEPDHKTYQINKGPILTALTVSEVDEISRYTVGQTTSQLQMKGTPGQFLWFDGVNFNIVDCSTREIIRSYAAYSGKPGLTCDIANQKKKDAGCIPEGLYYIDQRMTLSQDKADSTWDWIKWEFKAGSWGKFATPLLPVADTETYGRGSFFIHGGRIPGSIGCIDLVSANQAFHSWFESRHKPGNPATTAMVAGDLVLVHYVPLARMIPRTHDVPAACPDDTRYFCTNNKSCSRNVAYTGASSNYPEQRNAALKSILTDILV